MNDKKGPEESAREMLARYCLHDDRTSYERMLKFYRQEISHEHRLIAERLGWYVAAQAFLMLSVVTGLLLESKHELAPLIQVVATVVLPSVGLISTALFLPSALVSAKTIDKWREKQSKLYGLAPKQFEYFYSIDRNDNWHSKSMAATHLTPDLFGLAWLFILAAQCPVPWPVSWSVLWPVWLAVVIVILCVGWILFKCWPYDSPTAETPAKDTRPKPIESWLRPVLWFALFLVGIFCLPPLIEGLASAPRSIEKGLPYLQDLGN